MIKTVEKEIRYRHISKRPFCKAVVAGVRDAVVSTVSDSSVVIHGERQCLIITKVCMDLLPAHAKVDHFHKQTTRIPNKVNHCLVSAQAPLLYLHFSLPSSTLDFSNNWPKLSRSPEISTLCR